MKDVIFTVKKNVPLTKNVYEMTLSGDTSGITRPGQFVNVKLDGLYLRRPISVCEKIRDKLILVYKVVGAGTEQMARLRNGAELSVLTGLGNGYDISVSGEYPLLIGGGVGVPPLYMLAGKLLELDIHPSVIIGFNTKDEVFYEKEFSRLGVPVEVTTVDGSYGTKGFVTDVLDQYFVTDDIDPYEPTYYYACGPLPMLKAVYKTCRTSGQLSFEERMGCGFGACMGCSCKTITGYKRICKDGPVLYKEEILWEK